MIFERSHYADIQYCIIIYHQIQNTGLCHIPRIRTFSYVFCLQLEYYAMSLKILKWSNSLNMKIYKHNHTDLTNIYWLFNYIFHILEYACASTAHLFFNNVYLTLISTISNTSKSTLRAVPLRKVEMVNFLNRSNTLLLVFICWTTKFFLKTIFFSLTSILSKVPVCPIFLNIYSFKYWKINYIFSTIFQHFFNAGV